MVAWFCMLLKDRWSGRESTQSPDADRLKLAFTVPSQSVIGRGLVSESWERGIVYNIWLKM